MAHYETADGVYSTVYKSIILTRVAAMQAAGMKVTVSLGLHFTPAWVVNQPNAHFVSEDGAVSSETDLARPELQLIPVVLQPGSPDNYVMSARTSGRGVLPLWSSLTSDC